MLAGCCFDMNTPRFSLLAPVAAFAIIGCADSDSRYAHETAPYTEPGTVVTAEGQPMESGTVGGVTTTTNIPSTSPTASTRRPATNEPRPWDSSGSTAGAPAATTQFPVAQKISGKPGLVRSPYAPYAGEVDVKGISAGTQVKCPYTGKIFIVP